MITYKVGSTIQFGSFLWRILDIQGDKALLLTDEIVGQHPYNNQAGDVTWADCSIRTYLNNEFYNSFTDAEKARIIPVINNNQDNQWYGSEGGKESKDHVFLLSIEEAVCHYFGDSSKLLNNPSPKQRYWFQRKDINNDTRRSSYEGKIWWWWLRSPGRDNRRAVYIHGDGNVGIQGNGTYRYNSKIIHPLTGDNYGGLRPALWLSLVE